MEARPSVSVALSVDAQRATTWIVLSSMSPKPEPQTNAIPAPSRLPAPPGGAQDVVIGQGQDIDAAFRGACDDDGRRRQQPIGNESNDSEGRNAASPGSCVNRQLREPGAGSFRSPACARGMSR
jgi:hypothetical protein